MSNTQIELEKMRRAEKALTAHVDVKYVLLVQC